MTAVDPVAGRSDFVSLADRLGALQLVRLGLAATVLVAAATPEGLGVPVHAVAPVTAVYLLATVAAEGYRRLRAMRGIGLATAMLLVDGIYLAVVLAPVGGPRHILITLVYIHLIAVTLLTSWRTGLKLAVWHGLLMVVRYALEVDGIAPRLLGLDIGVTAPARDVAEGAIAFWVVAICTAVFAGLSERELRRGKAELAALARMGASFESGAAAADVGRVLLEHVVAVFGFACAAVITTPSAGGLGLRTAPGRTRSGVRVDSIDVPVAHLEHDELVRRCWDVRAPVLARRLVTADDPVLAAALPGSSNLIVVPLIAEEPIGVLVVERGGALGAVVTRATVAGLASFAGHAALALRTASLVAEIERVARTDPLTGLANRRVFESALNREVARAARSGDPLSLVILDVDGFKAVNDRYGHQVGDEVLRHVGRSLNSDARTTDLAARYGGEEFCVLLPACGPEEALVVAERLRADIAASGQSLPVSVTASAGVATMPVNASDGSTLVAAADDAMYEAKRAGRDRSCQSTRRSGIRMAV
jgi:diguanylate cyclase (GGDEF)-like protein